MTSKLPHTTLFLMGREPTAPKEMGGMESTSAVEVKMETAVVKSLGRGTVGVSVVVCGADNFPPFTQYSPSANCVVISTRLQNS